VVWKEKLMFVQLKEKKWFNTSNLLRFSLIFLILVVAIIFALNFDIQTIKTYIRNNPYQAFLISGLAYILFGLTFIPTFPLTVFNAIVIGPVQAAMIATLGNTIAAIIAYEFGKTMGDVVDFEKKKSKLPFGLGKLPIKSPAFMLIARSLPAGSRAYSMVCGAYEVPKPLYIWTTSLMFFVYSAFLAFGGLTLLHF
jgi:uncharacterized membrane protein YdjX (TVP38/TMEM64 family)